MKKWIFTLLLALFLALVPQSGFAENACSEVRLMQGEVAVAESPADGSDLIVVTLNTARETDINEIVRDIEEAKRIRQADVWMLQEFAQPKDRAEAGLLELARRLNMQFVYAPSDVMEGGQLLSGLAIFSRYKLSDPEVLPLKRFSLKINTRCRIALAATVETPMGLVRIVNVHLDTRINKKQRLEQIRPILEEASQHSIPKLIAGDFNTANFRWIGNLWPLPFIENQSDAVRRLLESNQFSTPFANGPSTFKSSPIPLKLDWIFLNGFKTISWGLENVDFSDHFALWVRLSKGS